MIPPNFQFLFIGCPKIQLIISVYMLQKVSYYFIYSKSILIVMLLYFFLILYVINWEFGFLYIFRHM